MIKGSSIPATDEAQNEKEYKQLMGLFTQLLSRLRDADTKEEALEELANYRATCMIEKAIVPFYMDVEEALQLLRSTNDEYLTQNERDKKDRLIKAIDNIIEFCTCAEYHAMIEAEEQNEEDDIDLEGVSLDNVDEDDEDDPVLPYWKINRRYNHTYKDTEEDDVVYAMGICYAWLRHGDNEELTYMTQNDDRVRPWHYALQGFTAPKKDFPAWMIPPIEWRCRCFLLTSSGDVFAKSAITTAPEMPKELDGVFAESICTGGRIFSDKHPYFTISSWDKNMLDRISNNIKEKWYGKK